MIRQLHIIAYLLLQVGQTQPWSFSPARCVRKQCSSDAQATAVLMFDRHVGFIATLHQEERIRHLDDLTVVRHAHGPETCLTMETSWTKQQKRRQACKYMYLLVLIHTPLRTLGSKTLKT